MIAFQWKHYPTRCNLCGECVDTCGNALTISNLKRIIRNQEKCTRCEACSTICSNIETEFIKE